MSTFKQNGALDVKKYNGIHLSNDSLLEGEENSSCASNSSTSVTPLRQDSEDALANINTLPKKRTRRSSSYDEDQEQTKKMKPGKEEYDKNGNDLNLSGSEVIENSKKVNAGLDELNDKSTHEKTEGQCDITLDVNTDLESNKNGHEMKSEFLSRKHKRKMNNTEDDEHDRGPRCPGRALQRCRNRVTVTKQTQSRHILPPNQVKCAGRGLFPDANRQLQHGNSNRQLSLPGTSQQWRINSADRQRQNNQVFLSKSQQQNTIGRQNNQVFHRAGQQHITTGIQNNQVFRRTGQQHITTGIQNNQVSPRTGQQHITTGIQNNQIFPRTGQQHITSGIQHNQVFPITGQQHINSGIQNNQGLPKTGIQNMRVFPSKSQQHDITIGRQNNQVFRGTGQQDIITGTQNNQVFPSKSQQHINTGNLSQTNRTLPGCDQSWRANSDRQLEDNQVRAGPSGNTGNMTHAHSRPQHTRGASRGRRGTSETRPRADYQPRRNERSIFNRQNQHEFHILDKMANGDDVDILGEINSKKDVILKLFQQPVKKLDLFVLTVKILSKLCESPYDELKLKILLTVCNETFIMQLRNYLMDIPYQRDKAHNSLYWKDQNEFWRNFIFFCESIVNLSPSKAMQLCRSLIDNVSKCCLDELGTKHGFTLIDSESNRLADVREKLVQYEKQDKPEKKVERTRDDDNGEDETEPPELFRVLPIIPDHYHLMRRPFLRPNIVNGAYKDVEHYLDIQFRLMLEDCYGPLRKGILQYLDNPTKSKYDNIRVYKNVTFMGPYVSDNKIGVLVKMEEKSNKRLRRIKWATSKRLLFGSLVILSKDNFKKFIVATVLDRDVTYLQQGKLPISIVNNDYHDDKYTNESYTMIESEVYFEPYYHVLKVLQDSKFPAHLSMQNYIVKAIPSNAPPKYLTIEREYLVEKTEEDLLRPDLQFHVLQDKTWPTAAELGLNNSQYEAYKLALTHEFAVIQGPPGTGKTFLGVKIAKTLLQNLKYSMLVICYTNHALDQFLENILSFTNSIARIGGQSRNEALEEFNLTKNRRNVPFSTSYGLFRDQKNCLKDAVRRLKTLQNHIETLENGVLTADSVKTYRYEEEIKIIERYYNDNHAKSVGDALYMWLFENLNNDSSGLDDEDENMVENDDIEEDVRTKRHVNLDDDEDEDGNDVVHITINTSFNLETAETGLKYLRSKYKAPSPTENKEQLQAEIQILNAHIALFKNMKQQYNAGNGEPQSLRGRNVRVMSNIDRWSVYFSWRDAIKNNIKQKFESLEGDFVRENNAYEEARMNLDREILQNVKVIGMTTTGAARLQKLLQELRPRIVIVEEAAEVLEQHIVSALTSRCEHLILIGDHQQLRPSAAYMKLARDYNIEISLFERMIKNNIPSQRLSVQHRMRPEIVSLIVPHIYRDLENHPHVENKPDIRGITNNVFFFSHNFMEQHVDDGSSRTNHQEADLALGLANYLIQQDYKPEDVTILAAYSGQMFYMRTQRNYYKHLSNVKITVVDNYQGEESKIIILSLVRNNNEDSIGFLSIENRVCVALSRAKEGFFIFGNIDILKRKSELWTNISITLERMGSLGTSLRLKCQMHPTQITTINESRDFDKVPEGGCLLKCDYILECTHQCPQMCHGYDRAHKNIECVQKCEKILCHLNHVCPRMCKDICMPCAVSVEKPLPCGHNMMLPCHQDPKDSAIKCTTVLPVTLPNCGHAAKKACYMDINKVRCIVKCVFRVEKCGHACTRDCHVTDDPDHEKYVCFKPCAKAKNGCSANLSGDRGKHQCLKACHETCDDCKVKVLKKRSSCKHSDKVDCGSDVNATPCNTNCGRILPCGHYCFRKCFEECGGCTTEVLKPVPGCNHMVKIECNMEPSRTDCRERCNRTLVCGHPCTERCDKPCDSTKCTVLTSRQYRSLCGHPVFLPCIIAREWSSYDLQERDEILLKHCKNPCNQTLECDHICSGTCAECYQGRLHVPCKKTCHQQNICGHQCEEPCNQVCPPCKKKCEVRCPHSQCNKRCGAPCGIPCQEKCSRTCPHGACENRCGEKCTRPACSEPCQRDLRCGHRCRGLCGEPCLTICNVCNPDEFPQSGFIKEEFDDDDKFIQLQDCPHVLEVEDMDTLMEADSSTIAIRQCPYCRKPIINTRRYKDVIDSMFKVNINPIKEKVYGNKIQIEEKQKELIENIIRLKVVHDVVIQDNIHFNNAFKAHKLNRKHVSLLELQMTIIYYEVLDIVGEYYTKYRNAELSALENEFLNQIKLICGFIRGSVLKISRQQQNDIKNELERMSSIIKLAQIISHPSYLQSKTEFTVKAAFEAAQKTVFSWHVFNSDLTKDALMNLQKTVKVFGVTTEQERKMIVQAIGLKAGHWFKCPNGHFYCIGECGGAMQIGHCIECRANVGGTSHNLLSTNTHASELDGSSHPAWSEHNNNMANFNFDDLL